MKLIFGWVIPIALASAAYGISGELLYPRGHTWWACAVVWLAAVFSTKAQDFADTI